MTPTEAIENNVYAFPLFHAWSRAEGYDGPDLLWALSDIPAPYFNRVGRANLRESEAAAAIAAAIARARAKKVSLVWWVGPSSQPVDLRQRLVAQGFRHTVDVVGMATELERELAGSLLVRVERVRDRELLRVWDDIPRLSEERYGFYAEHLDASFRHYVGYVDGVPVGTSSLFFGGGTAGIYSMFTVEEMRGRGVGTALARAAMNDARRLGYRQVVLLARLTAAGFYARLGFAEHCRFGNYLWEE